MKNKILIVFFFFLFWGLIKPSLIDISDQEFIKELKTRDALDADEKNIKNYLVGAFPLNSLSYPFLDSAIITCNRYTDVLTTVLENPEYTIKAGFWRFIPHVF